MEPLTAQARAMSVLEDVSNCKMHMSILIPL